MERRKLIIDSWKCVVSALMYALLAGTGLKVFSVIGEYLISMSRELLSGSISSTIIADAILGVITLLPTGFMITLCAHLILRSVVAACRMIIKLDVMDEQNEEERKKAEENAENSDNAENAPNGNMLVNVNG